MNSTRAYEKDLTEALLTRLSGVFERLAAFDKDPESLGEVSVIADRMVASIPQSNSLNLELGPFYTTSALTKWLGVTRQYVFELTKQKRILALTTADRHRVYPAFQFGIRGATLPGLPKAITALSPIVEPRTIGMWLVTGQPELDGLTPAAWLQDERPTKAVEICAKRYTALLRDQHSVPTP